MILDKSNGYTSGRTDYPGSGERDLIGDNKRSNRQALIEKWQSAYFNVGPGGVQSLGESIEVDEAAIVERGFRRQLSREPLLFEDDSRFAPEGQASVNRLHAVIIDGDKAYAVSSRQTEAGRRVALIQLGYGANNEDYNERPHSSILEEANVEPTGSTGEPDAISSIEIGAAGLRVECRGDDIFVGPDEEDGSDSITLIDGWLGLAESDKLMARNGYTALMQLLADNGNSWKA